MMQETPQSQAEEECEIETHTIPLTDWAAAKKHIVRKVKAEKATELRMKQLSAHRKERKAKRRARKRVNR